MSYETGTLRAWFERILQSYEYYHGKSVSLKEGFYWEMPAESRYDLDKSPDVEDFTLGHLHDCVEFLKRSKNAEETIPYECVWLAALLRYMGETSKPK